MQCLFEELKRRGSCVCPTLKVSLSISGNKAELEKALEAVNRAYPEAKFIIKEINDEVNGLDLKKRNELQSLLQDICPDVDASSSENACVICLEKERKIALIHGTTAHGVVCYACAIKCKFIGRCPVCREPIEGSRRLEDLENSDIKVF